MKLTAKGRYAVTAMLDLALQGDETVCLSDIADRQTISLAYLEQLFLMLRRHGLVISHRGVKGGYRLAMDANDISVATIIRSTGEDMEFTRCRGKENCHDHGRCLTHDLWTGLNEIIADYLESISLGELCRQQSERATFTRKKSSKKTGKAATRLHDIPVFSQITGKPG